MPHHESIIDVLTLRKSLRLSRAEFARFLGVSEATVVRWESKDSVTEPKGLQAVLLRAIADAAASHSPEEIMRLVRSSGLDHRSALERLLAASRQAHPDLRKASATM
jgi:transcriptional regulator with XRE-family HTH domain